METKETCHPQVPGAVLHGAGLQVCVGKEGHEDGGLRVLQGRGQILLLQVSGLRLRVRVRWRGDCNTFGAPSGASCARRAPYPPGNSHDPCAHASSSSQDALHRKPQEQRHAEHLHQHWGTVRLGP